MTERLAALDVFGAAKEVVEVIAKLCPAVSAAITVVNETNCTLRKTSDAHRSGSFAVLPAREIPPGGRDDFASASSARAVARGTSGTVTYFVHGGGTAVTHWTVHWDNPVVGTASASHRLEGYMPASLSSNDEHGETHNAPFRFTLAGHVEHGE